jgi:hypothetical protein
MSLDPTSPHFLFYVHFPILEPHNIGAFFTITLIVRRLEATLDEQTGGPHRFCSNNIPESKVFRRTHDSVYPRLIIPNVTAPSFSERCNLNSKAKIGHRVSGVVPQGTNENPYLL